MVNWVTSITGHRFSNVDNITIEGRTLLFMILRCRQRLNSCFNPVVLIQRGNVLHPVKLWLDTEMDM